MRQVFEFATVCALLFGIGQMRAAPTSAERVGEIQKALQAAKIDGWLFYDFRGSDLIALRVLKLDEHAIGSRRWFYYVPKTGEPTKIVHREQKAAHRDAILPHERRALHVEGGRGHDRTGPLVRCRTCDQRRACPT